MCDCFHSVLLIEGKIVFRCKKTHYTRYVNDMKYKSYSPNVVDTIVKTILPHNQLGKYCDRFCCVDKRLNKQSHHRKNAKRKMRREKVNN